MDANKIKEVVEKIVKDPELQKQFMSDPVKAVESLIGVDLPDDQINAVINQAKDAIAKNGANGLMDKVKELIGK